MDHILRPVRGHLRVHGNSDSLCTSECALQLHHGVKRQEAEPPVWGQMQKLRVMVTMDQEQHWKERNRRV